MTIIRNVIRNGIIRPVIRPVIRGPSGPFFFDNFNRPDELLDASSNWIKIGTNPDSAAIRNNKVATITGDQNFYASPDINSTSQYTEVKLENINATQNYFICCVRTSSAVDFYGLFYTGGLLRLEKRAGGAFIQVGTYLYSAVSGDILKISVNDLNEFKVFVNNIRVIGPIIDGFNAAETRQGFVTRSSITDPGAAFDDYSTGLVPANAAFGFIPYGSTDQAVLMQCSLKSSTEVSNCGGLVLGTGTIFDTVKGVTATEGVQSGLEFLDIVGYSALENNFQISFDVEADYLSLSDPTLVGEAGKVKDGTVNFLMTWNAGGGGDYGFFRMDLDSLSFRSLFNDTFIGVSTTMSDRVGNFKRVTVSNKAGTITLYIDKKPISRYVNPAPTPTFFTDMFKRISLLNYAGQLGSVENLTYMKDIVIATRPVETFPIPTLLLNIGFFGHSFVMTFGESTNTDQIGDSNLISMIQREFMNIGYDLNYYQAGTPGGTTINTGGNPLNILLAGFMASSPSVIVFITGANDCAATGTYDEDTYRTDLRLMLTTMLSGTNVPLVVLPNVPSIKANSANDGAAYVATVASANIVHNESAAWWAGVKGVNDGDILVANYFDITGGETLLPNMFRGQFNTLNNNLHPGPSGHNVMGKEIFDKMRGYV